MNRQTNQRRFITRLTSAVVLSTALLGLSQTVVADPPAHARGEALPPGLAKQDKLPPGWEKKLQAGSRIDDDIYEHARRLPGHEDDDGVVTIEIGGKLARVIEETQEVVEVLE